MPLLNKLRRHPFPVDAHFERVFAASFAFPAAVLRPIVPPALELDIYEGFGFVTVAMVWTRNLRPSGFPPFLGQNFLLAGYRIFTRFRDDTGRQLRGLYIIRSETDKRRMAWAGNLFTKYHYRPVDVKVETSGTITRVITSLSDGGTSADITFDAQAETASPPTGSPFHDWHTARQFAGPMPFTFSTEGDDTVVIIEGNRQNWVPRPVIVKDWRVSLFDETAFRGTTPALANAFTAADIDYHWKKGRIVKLKKPA